MEFPRRRSEWGERFRRLRRRVPDGPFPFATATGYNSAPRHRQPRPISAPAWAETDRGRRRCRARIPPEARRRPPPGRHPARPGIPTGAPPPYCGPRTAAAPCAHPGANIDSPAGSARPIRHKNTPAVTPESQSRNSECVPLTRLRPYVHVNLPRVTCHHGRRSEFRCVHMTKLALSPFPP